MKKPVIVLFGPTASGKTAVIERLGRRLDKLEIISADSMQVYRGMDIGTAKPSLVERAKIPYHLLDIRNPNEQFNAGDFVRLAEEACLDISSRGALPLVSGGTGFYLKNLVSGLSQAPPSDETIRRQLKEELEQRGPIPLMEELSKADPVSSSRIHINDSYRLLRALEVFRLCGRPLSSFASPWSSSGAQSAQCGRSGHCNSGGNSRFLLAGLRRNREELYRRINARCAAMFKAGLKDEVKRLYEAGYTPSDPGLRAIGYREFFVEDETSAIIGSWRLSEDLAGVEALVAQNSRHYAKRQITLFASLPGVKWIDCGDDDDETANEIYREWGV